MRIKGIILLGGTSERFDDAIPKQFHRLSGKKVYLHTLEKFVSMDFFDEILLVADAKHLQEVIQDTKKFSRVRVVQGGNTRQSSSYQGILHCGRDTDYVIIHDAVRPFVSKKILQENREKVIAFGAVDTCAPSFDTIVECKDGEKINRIPNRSHYLRGQTPQSFSYELILRAHIEALKAGIEGVSDDCQLVLRLGEKIHVVEGSERNIKITTKLDLYIGEQLMRMQEEYVASEARSIKGKLYVIVGGTGGIGSALRKELEEECVKVLLVSKSSKSYPVDITSPDQLAKVFKRIYQEHGLIDGLINAAGVLRKKRVDCLEEHEIQEQLLVNLHGVIHACRFARMQKDGHIVNIASSSFSRGRAESVIYSAAKAGVVNFTQGFAEEHPELHVNVIVPQRTHTKLRKMNFHEEDETTLLSPEVVAQVIIKLLKEENITGQIIEVRQ
ncbi:MAG: bifunctional cytidylyltransferase/SDR family oxidoreductase [Chlamydiales bacterium]|nr:bifunctional cytidylyltransferase/SDR family oxidoreductase [Chlamydiales bacterium]